MEKAILISYWELWEVIFLCFIILSVKVVLMCELSRILELMHLGQSCSPSNSFNMIYYFHPFSHSLYIFASRMRVKFYFLFPHISWYMMVQPNAKRSLKLWDTLLQKPMLKALLIADRGHHNHETSQSFSWWFVSLLSCNHSSFIQQ